jgi:hypothetical protein
MDLGPLFDAVRGQVTTGEAGDSGDEHTHSEKPYKQNTERPLPDVSVLCARLAQVPQTFYGSFTLLIRRAILACLLAVLGTFAVGMSMAVAGPRDVFADWWADGVIDETYSLSDLRGALDLPGTKGGTYDSFRDIVNGEITRLVTGGKDETPGSSNRSAPVDKGATPPAQPDNGNAPNETPSASPPSVPVGGPSPPPAAVAQDEDLPTAFIALAVFAGLLVLVGGGTAVLRRFRRR